MNKAADAPPASALELRFGQVGMLQIRLRTLQPSEVQEELRARIAAAPHFFRHTAVCLDLAALAGEPDEAGLRGVIDAVRSAGLITAGLADTTRVAEQLAPALGLPLLGSFSAGSRTGSAAPAQKAPPPVGQPALLQQQPVRSGQRVYGRDRDVIVTATVGAGAEVMADGCVHVYGSLRGRVMAGVRGETSARVFCQDFRAELIAIAGVFRVFETIPAELLGHSVQAWLDGEVLHFARLTF